MASLEISRGADGMQRSLRESEERIVLALEEPLKRPRPGGAVERRRAEEDTVRAGLEVAALMTVRQVRQCHLDKILVREAVAPGRSRLLDAGAKAVAHGGWEEVEVQRRGGLRVRLRPPSLRRAGLELGISTMVRVALHPGERALDLRAQALEQARQAPFAPHAPLAGRRVRISLDGGRRRVRHTPRGRGIRPGQNGRRPFALSWQAPRLLTIEGVDEHGAMDRRWRPIYAGGLGEAEEVFTLLSGLLRLLGVPRAAQVLCVSHGAEWIWTRIEQLLVDVGLDATKVELALDDYHATEHLSEALSACKSLAAKAPQALFDELCRVVLEPGGAEKVVQRLGALARGRRATTINKESKHLSTHLASMRYPERRAKNLPPGSGVVESAMRRVVNLRCTSASQCWAPENPEPLLYL